VLEPRWQGIRRIETVVRLHEQARGADLLRKPSTYNSKHHHHARAGPLQFLPQVLCTRMRAYARR
jgi:hypothetical protein